MSNMRWVALSALLMAVPLGMSASCSDDGDTGAGGQGGSTGQSPVGDPCTSDTQCIGGLCLDDETFASLTEGNQTAHIPDGYCSELACPKNQGEEACGPDAFCFDLEAYVETPFTACFKLCNTEADCRDGYRCTDASSSTLYPPLPHKACIAPDLLCLLEVPDPACPDGGGGSGGSGGSGGFVSGGGGGAGGSGGG